MKWLTVSMTTALIGLATFSATASGREKADPSAARRPDAAPGKTPPRRPAAGGARQRAASAARLRQVMAAQNALLRARYAELQRWDAAAQQKFMRAFGTTDATTRERIMKHMEVLFDRNQKRIAQITDAINFQAFMESRKVK